MVALYMFRRPRQSQGLLYKLIKSFAHLLPHLLLLCRQVKMIKENAILYKINFVTQL